ncbi:MAG: hemolysin E, partial [Pseudomonadales bacterium]
MISRSLFTNVALTLTFALIYHIPPAWSEASTAESTLAEAEEKLTSYEQRIGRLNKRIAQLPEHIEQARQSLAKEKENLGEIKDHYQKKELSYQAALTLSETSPSDTNIAKAKNSRFQFYLAEKKLQRQQELVAS